MTRGDVLAELRAWRDEFARSHGYDIHRMVAALREHEIASGREVVRGEPRRPTVGMPHKPPPPAGATPPAGSGPLSPEATPATER